MASLAPAVDITSPTVYQVLTLYKSHRELFERLIRVTKDPEKSGSILVLWLWLSCIGVYVIVQVTEVDDGELLGFIAEAEAIISTILDYEMVLGSQIPAVDLETPIPLLKSGSALYLPHLRHLNLKFFAYNRDIAVRGMADFMDGDGKVIFDDGLYEIIRWFEEEEKKNTCEGEVVVPRELSWPFYQYHMTAPEYQRTVYFQFQKNYSPFTREELALYFHQKWGPNIVESVTFDIVRRDWIYGRAVMRSKSVVDLVFNEKRRRLPQLVFKVDDKRSFDAQRYPRGPYIRDPNSSIKRWRNQQLH